MMSKKDNQAQLSKSNPMKRLQYLFICLFMLGVCFILLGVFVCDKPDVIPENTPAPAAEPIVLATAAAVTSSPAPTEIPQPQILPIDDPRDFLVGYWADDTPYENPYTYEYDEEGDPIYSFVLSPYENSIRYAFYPDGQFLRATPQSEGGYPIWEYGTWQLSDTHDFVSLLILQCYECGEDGIYIQLNHKCIVEIPISIGSEYRFHIIGPYGRTSSDKIMINDMEFVRENGTWDLMNDFSYASTGKMYHGNSWDSDADMAFFNGKYGLPKVYFEETLLSESSPYHIQLSRGTYGFLAHWDTYPTLEEMEWFIPFFNDGSIENYENRRIRFTGYTFFHEGFGFYITDFEILPE
ncbi:MAG: hypothetical protein FWE69_07100 [Clostridiales bacterium]|nr:hypothetical protein [Clostridiales bacterium]